MRTFFLFLIMLGLSFHASAQITFLSPFTGNQGGSTPLFGQYVPDGSSNMFLDWECFGSSTAGAGQGSDCRVIVRGISPDADPESVIASSVICVVNGIYNGENGNNDRFFANLNVCNLADGRYSVEVQCDESGGDFDNSTGASTATTSWNYWDPEAPTAYYLGTAGSCGQGDGLDNITEVGEGGVAGTPQIEFFNVGDASVYRTAVVLNGLFMDMAKFQPGNPALPTSLNDLQTLYDPACVGVGTFPATEFCTGDQLTLDGAEVNITKYTTCGADVTGNRMLWRLYLSSATPPPFSSFNIDFNANCPGGYPSNNNFPLAGSCQNQNGIQDQRWSTIGQNIDLMAMATVPGTYMLEFYTETDVVDCGGTASTVREPATGQYNTEFKVCTALPVALTEFNVTKAGKQANIRWTTATEQASSHFVVQRSPDGRRFETLTTIASAGASDVAVNYEVADANPLNNNNYYRLKMVDLDGSFTFSEIKTLRFGNEQDLLVYPSITQTEITLALGVPFQQDAQITVYSLLGEVVMTARLPATSSKSTVEVSQLPTGSYVVMVTDGATALSGKFIRE